MAQDKKRRDEDRGRPEGGRGEHDRDTENSQRFRGEMEGDRNDGGFLPVNENAEQRMRGYGDPERGNPEQDPLRGEPRHERGWDRWQADRRMAYGDDTGEFGRGAPPARAGGSDDRRRWDQGTDQGGRFGRDRDYARDRHMEYGDPDYGAYGMQRGARWPDEQQWRSQRPAERHQGDEHRDYRAWREEQMRRCDEEYAEYCRERQEKFNQDFEEWRRARAGRASRVDLPGTTAGDIESPTSVRGPSNDIIKP